MVDSLAVAKYEPASFASISTKLINCMIKLIYREISVKLRK